MATQNPRVYITLDKDLYHQTEALAKKKNISLSLLLRDKIKEALDWEETFEILKDKNAMEAIQVSLAEIRKGEPGTPWRKLFNV